MKVVTSSGISIADSSIVESDTNQTMNFTVTRTGDLSGASSMTWTLFNGTTAAGDFSGATTGTVSFAAGESSADLHEVMTGAVTSYVEDVKSGDFPNESEQY